MKREKPEKLKPAEGLPSYWATLMALEHMPGNSGRPIPPPVAKRIRRTRR